jgi:hypothetical protein
MLAPHHRENPEFGVTWLSPAEDFLGVGVFLGCQVVFRNQFGRYGGFGHHRNFGSDSGFKLKLAAQSLRPWGHMAKKANRRSMKFFLP